MKLVVCDGRELTIRDAGPVLMRFVARTGGPPIKRHGASLVEDDEARSIARDLISAGWYDRTEVTR